MVILSLSLLHTVDQKTFFLDTTQNLAHINFIYRGTVAEILTFAARSIVQELAGPARAKKLESCLYKDYLCHLYRQDGPLGKEIYAVAITDGAFSPRLAGSLLLEALNLPRVSFDRLPEDQQLAIPQMAPLLLRYNEMKPDKIAQIEANIDATKRILIDATEKLILRGEKLETLAAASEDLSFKSKAFVQSTKDLNRCCNLL